MSLLIIILVIVVLIFLVLKLYPPLGATPSKKDKEDYAKRAENYKDGKFYNESDYQMIYESTKQDKYVSTKGITPEESLPLEKPTFDKKPAIDTLNLTWFGHSSILMQMHGMNILIDPVFGDYASPVSFTGPQRFTETPITTDELPTIDILVISHDHYDHLDYKTIKEIDSKVKQYIVPLGVENHLESWGVSKEKITNMAWWEETTVNGLTIASTPARHYSRRSINDSYSTLWTSWVFMDENYKVYESGDSGYDNHFKKINEKYGEFDLALLDSGQYNSRWKSTHMTPEESVTAGMDLQAKVIMPIHWGSFVLANHPWDDSVERFTLKAEEENIKYVTPKIGETLKYEENMSTEKWWTDIK